MLGAACSGHGTLDSTASPTAPTDGTAPGGQLPAPADALRGLSFEDVQQFRFGREYEDALPWRNVERQGNLAQFWPQGNGLDQLALAVYALELADYDEETALYLKWNQAPNNGSLHLALANWSTQRWDWFSPASPDTLKLTELKPYLDAAGHCLVAISVGGLQPGILERFSFGVISQPQAVEILHVAPQGGTKGTAVRFGAKLAGSEPLSYAWDFGGGASPNTSSEANPLVQLGDTGVYTARLSVANRFSSSEYSFALQILPQSSWVHTLGAKKAETIKAVAGDQMGNVYAAVDLEYGESCLAKFSNIGELLWIRRLLDAGLLEPRQLSILADGSLLLGAATMAVDEPFNQSANGSMVLHLNAEGQALEAFALDAVGDFSFGADGSALLADYASGRLLCINSFNRIGWAAELSSGDGLHKPHAAQACIAADGGIWFACSIRSASLVDDGPCIAKLSSSGQLGWSRYSPLVGEQLVSGICALPDGVCLVVNPEDPRNAQADPRSLHMAAFDQQGSLVFRRHRESIGTDNPIQYRSGRIYVGGIERRERADGTDYYVALNSYDMQGQETVAWGLISLPAAFGVGLSLHPDGSLLLCGVANSAYVSTYQPGDPPLAGPVPDYFPIELGCSVLPLLAEERSFNSAERGMILDSGAGVEDGLLIKFDPQD